ncbi:unnamed protein product, partial [Effrenium voratum]
MFPEGPAALVNRAVQEAGESHRAPAVLFFTAACGAAQSTLQRLAAQEQAPFEVISLLDPSCTSKVAAAHARFSERHSGWLLLSDAELLERQLPKHPQLMTRADGSPVVGELAAGPGIEQLAGQRQVSQSIEANWEAISVTSRSFNGTAKTDPEGTCDWIMGPTLHQQWDHPGRRALFDWLMKVMWSWNLVSGGFALGAKKPDGSLGAVVLVTPYPKGIPGDITDAWEALRAMWHVGMPSRETKQLGDYRGIQARVVIAIFAIQEVKKRHCSGPHAHVKVMAVDPHAQGLGLCGKLMRAVSAWADDLQLPLWLETSGARNVAIYERFGYKTREHYALNYKNDVHEDEFGMMRMKRLRSLMDLARAAKLRKNGAPPVLLAAQLRDSDSSSGWAHLLEAEPVRAFLSWPVGLQANFRALKEEMSCELEGWQRDFCVLHAL